MTRFSPQFSERIAEVRRETLREQEALNERLRSQRAQAQAEARERLRYNRESLPRFLQDARIVGRAATRGNLKPSTRLVIDQGISRDFSSLVPLIGSPTSRSRKFSDVISGWSLDKIPARYVRDQEDGATQRRVVRSLSSVRSAGMKRLPLLTPEGTVYITDVEGRPFENNPDGSQLFILSSDSALPQNPQQLTLDTADDVIATIDIRAMEGRLAQYACRVSS